MFVLVKANGSKLCQIEYSCHGDEKLLSFGAYPKVGISAARELKKIAKGTLAEGRDAVEHKRGRDYLAKKTLWNVASSWHNNRVDSIKPAHAKRVWSPLERDVPGDLSC